MRLQVLLSVMHQNDRSIVKRANLQTDAIIVNQADDFRKDCFLNEGSEILIYTFDERGVGLSRNNALMRATADVVIFGDEDIRYVNNYDNIILSEFEKHPEADMILFNVPSDNIKRPTYMIPKWGRVRLRNCLRYGAVKFAIRTESMNRVNLSFSLLFGGGAKYSSGEDSLFIYSAIKRGLKVYACPEIIGHVSQEDSTWFSGYTKKFFSDKGTLFRTLSPAFYPVYIVRFIIRNRHNFPKEMNFMSVFKIMISESYEKL